MAAPQNLGQALVQTGLLDDAQLSRLSTSMTNTGRRLTEEIVASGLATEDRIVAELSRLLELDVVDPVRTPIHERVLEIVPAEIAYRHHVVPLARRKDGESESLFLVTSNPFDDDASSAVSALLPSGVDIKCVLAGDQEITNALTELYGPNPRPDTVSASAPRAAWDDSGGIRMGGSAAMPLSKSIIPDDALVDAVTRADAVTQADAPAVEPSSSVKPSSSPSVKPPSSPPTRADQLGAYALSERVGVSGMAETWDAYDTEAASPAARVRVRRMLPSLAKNERSRNKFFGAARRMVGVDHENLVVVVDAGTQGADDYVVTEPVDGHDLDRILTAASNKKVVFERGPALVVMQGILRGLQAAHDAMVFHEHLSPRTVVISEDGVVKVADFGVAPTLLEEHGRYLAPEQSSSAGADHRTDVFRAGAILFAMLTGEPLVDREVKESSVALDAIRGYRKRLSDREADPKVDKLLAGALHEDPARRFESAEAFLAEVERILENESGANEAALARFVDDTLHAGPGADHSAIDDAADALSHAAAASGRALRSAAEEVAPAVKRAKKRAVPVLEGIGEKGLDGFEKLMAAPGSVKLAVGVGVFLAVVMGSAVVALVMSNDDDTEPATIQIPDEPAAAIDSTEMEPADDVAAAPSRPTVEVFDGIFDGPPPPGHGFAAVHGLELRATADDDSEVMLWLEAGQVLERVRDMDGQSLVLVPPRGPAGFVVSDDLTQTLPLESLARQIAFEGCAVRRGSSRDDCLFDAKQSHNACLDRCEGRDGTRCKPACDLAFERCLTSCRESNERRRRPQARRGRRRR